MNILLLLSHLFFFFCHRLHRFLQIKTAKGGYFCENLNHHAVASTPEKKINKPLVICETTPIAIGGVNLCNLWQYAWLSSYKIFYLLLLVILFSCKSQSVSDTSVIPESNQEEKLKKNQFYAIVEQRRKSRTDSNLKETVLLIDEKRYFIKFDEGYVSEDKLLKHLNQKIKIKAEIKNGVFEADKPGSLAENTKPVKARSGEYIVVYKIISE